MCNLVVGASIHQLWGLGLMPLPLKLQFPCLKHGHKDTLFLAVMGIKGDTACRVLSLGPGTRPC